MANIKVPNKLDKDQLTDVLRRGLPDLDVRRIGPMISVSRSAWTAAWVSGSGHTVTCFPMVRSFAMFLLFCLIGITGIGLVLYGVIAIPKQKEIVKRVDMVIERELVHGHAGTSKHTRAA